MNINEYVKNNYIKLTTQEVRDLFNDVDANKDLIVRSQLALAFKLACSYTKTTNSNSEDLFATALEGLVKSIPTYDKNGEASFTTYCYQFMVWCLNNFQDDLIRLPHHKRKTEVNTKAYVFTTLDYQDNNFNFEETIRDDDDYKTCNEDKIIELIKETLKDYKNGERYSNLIIKYFGLGLNESLNMVKQAKEENVTHQNLNQIRNKVMDRLKENKEFKTALKRLTE